MDGRGLDGECGRGGGDMMFNDGMVLVLRTVFSFGFLGWMGY